MDKLNQSFDMSYIEKMSAGDKDTQKQLLKILVDELKNDLPRAPRLLASKDWDGLGRFCHHFKSTIAFTGNNTLIKANLQLWEIAKKQGKTNDNAERILNTMQQQAKRIEREVTAVLKKM